MFDRTPPDQTGQTDQKIGTFISGFKVSQPVELVLGISDGNKKQQGADLKAFVDMVNFNKIKIKSVEIMVTAYIHRHYCGEEEALKKGNFWISENKEILQGLKVPYIITDWKDIIETPEFQEGLKKVGFLYENDDAFKIKVNNMAQAHRQKGNFDTALAYLLEEAAYFTYKNVHVCYPADRLNIACEHIIENHNQNAVFHAYRFKPRFENKSTRTPPTKPKKNSTVPVSTYPAPPANNYLNFQPASSWGSHGTQEDLFFASLSLARLMSSIGINGTKQKAAYFQRVLQHTDDFMRTTVEGELDDGITDQEYKKTGLQAGC